VRGWRRRDVAPWKSSADQQLAWTNKQLTGRKSRKRRQMSLLDLPDDLLLYILEKLDPTSRAAATVACRTLGHIWQEKMEYEVEEEEEWRDVNYNFTTLDFLPLDVLLYLFKFLDTKHLGRMAQVCRRFQSLVYCDSVWLRKAARAFASNQLQPEIMQRSQVMYGARERVRLGENWRRGDCTQAIVTAHNNNMMPRVALERDALWVSWGKTIWCHPRVKQGGISAATTKMLRGHKDDVSKFVVAEGMVVSGGRDRSLFGWSSKTGEFLFARRYCHAGEISAVDVTGLGQIIVSGSRDKTLGVWALQENFNPALVKQLAVGDRVWSLNICKSSGLTAVGTAATRGTPPLRLFDLMQGRLVLDMGAELRNGAGMLDVRWVSSTSLLSCGYDTCTRLWDTRCGTYVSTWEEPNDEAVYCLDTDGVNCMVTGTNRFGRVGVWDLRSSKPLYMRHSTPFRRGHSSPVYSLAMDSGNIYAAMDQSLNHFSFH